MRIAAALHHDQIQHGEIGAVRFHESDVRFGGRGLDDDGQKFRLVLCGVQLLPQIFIRDSQAVFDLRQSFFDELRIVAEQQNAERRIAIDEHAAIAIEHRSARRDDGDGANAVLIGQDRRNARTGRLEASKIPLKGI